METMNSTIQRICAWCGPAYILFYMIGLLTAGMVPPPSPSLSALEIAEFYRGDTDMIRLGVVIAFVASILYLPFSIVITVQMLRMQGRSLILALLQLGGAVASTLILLVPPLLWITAAFHPERSPDVTQALNDLAWIMVIITLNTFMVQYIAIALAIFQDRARVPVFPRWLAFINLWVCFMFIPGPLLAFVHSGPFAYSGLLCFWAPLAAFVAWFLTMFAGLLGAIRQEAQLEDPGLQGYKAVAA